MRQLTEIRWHARAGQGAKTAAQTLALAYLRSGKYAQAFPEYGPERRGAPLRAYTRCSDRPIRRHDSIEHPDAVVVLEPSLLDTGVTEGAGSDAVVLVSGPGPAAAADQRLRFVPAPADTRFSNLTMLGAVAAALGEPPLEALEAAATDVLGAKADPAAVRRAISEGYRCLS